MKRKYLKSSRYHTIFSLFIAVVFFVVIIIKPDFSLGLSMIILLAYVAGNGIIHARHNRLERDTLTEYIIVSVIALVILINTIA